MNGYLGFGGLSASRGGFIGDIIGWLIRVAIYDIFISGIVEVFGVSRITAIGIFLGGLIGVAIVGYFVRQRMSTPVDS